MSETKATNQDNQDAKPVNGSPENGEESTSKATKTFTEKELNTILTQKGRDDKALSDRKAKLEEREANLLKWERERDSVELEAVKDDPIKMNIVKERQKLRLDREEVARTKREVDSQYEEIKQYKAEKSISEVASKYKVDVGLLKGTGITDPEALERVAAVISQTRVQNEETNIPDSGGTSGGGKTFTRSYIASIQGTKEYTEKRAEIKEAMANGRVLDK